MNKLRDDFRANAPISQVPASWFNGVARRLNGIVGGFGIDFHMGGGEASPIDIDFGELIAKNVFAPGFAEVPNTAAEAFVALTSGSTFTNATLVTNDTANGHTAGFECKFLTRVYSSGSTIKLFIRKFTFSIDGRVTSVADESQSVDLSNIVTSHTHGNITNDGKITASGNLGRILMNAAADGTIVASPVVAAELAAVMDAFDISTSGGDTTVKLPFGSIGGNGTGVLFLSDGAVSLRSIGTGSSQVAAGDHTHDYSSDYAAYSHTHEGVYQPYGIVPTHAHDIGDMTDNGGIIANAAAAAVSAAMGQGGGLEGVLFDDDIGDTVQAHSDALDALEATLDSTTGKVPISQIDGSGISGHSGKCLVTVDNAGNMSHSGNKAFDLLDAAANSGGQPRNNNKLITDLDISDGLEADPTTHNLKVKCKSDGGIALDSSTKDLKLGSLGSGNANKFLKTDSNGNIVPTTDRVVIVPAGFDFSEMFSVTVSGTRIYVTLKPLTIDAQTGQLGWGTPKNFNCVGQVSS